MFQYSFEEKRLHKLMNKEMSKSILKGSKSISYLGRI